MHRFFVPWVTLAVTIGMTGCATVTPDSRLAEARTLVEQARQRPQAQAARAAIHDAVEAIEFAEFEEQQAPGHRLAEPRAAWALDKARTALLACEAPHAEIAK